MRATEGLVQHGFAKKAGQWLIEHLCFVSSSVLADSFRLQYPPTSCSCKPLGGTLLC
jgi:hypothetical protein